MSEAQPMQVSSVPPIFCSVNQAAQALSLQPYTVRELCKAKAIKATKFGNRWLVSVPDLERYAADRLAASA